MRPALNDTPAPVRIPARREPIGRVDGAGFELVTWSDGALCVGAESALGRLRFRIVLDADLHPRPLMEMPPRDPDPAALAGIVAALDAVLRDPDNGAVLARLIRDAAGREAGRLAGTAADRRAQALALLRSDLATWLAFPAASRQALDRFLPRCGSGAMPPAPEAGRIEISTAAAEKAVAAMMGGAARPGTCRSDPCLSVLTAAIERARRLGVRSTRHVAVGSPPEEALRLAAVPTCIGFAALEGEIAARRVSAEDLLVVSCAVPGDVNLARLLRALSRANAAPRLVIYDADEILVGTAPALSRLLGIPVAA